MGSATRARLPESLEPGNDSFLVRGVAEILALLRGIRHAESLVTAYAGGAGEFFASTILAVDALPGEFLLEAGPGTVLPETAQMLTVVTFLDNVKVQFEAAMLGTVGHEGQRALRMRVPSRVLRLQRRESFRVETPPLRAPVCRIPADGGRPELEIRVADVSCGGIALALAPGDVRLEPGDILRGCLLELPGLTPIAVSIEARHADRPAKTPVAGLRTCGCRFVDLPGPAETQIQRYVSAVERERLRLRA
ncbi:MAG: flagellar brake protein [Betaproteobacteria bacterium]|nr:flagellar brake protein [Betaproteobacteria bacterium]